MGGSETGQGHPARATGATGDPWHAVVLAAGRGTRMGGPKALMRVGGRVWWEVQEERLGRAGVARTWVVSGDVAAGMKGCGSPLVIADSDSPMFESVRVGIAAAPSESGVFVLPVDVPAAGADVLGSLVRAVADGVAVPVYREQHGHPVALSRSWIDRVFAAALRASGTHRLDELIASETAFVPVEEEAVVVNLNTPADVLRWTDG